MDFNLISLGCAKNRVDSEIVLADLMDRGHQPVDEPGDAELILVNTCAFIQPAVDEAIDTLLEAAAFKTEGRARFVVGLGCLPQRYGQDLNLEMGEIDLFIPPANLPRAGQLIEDLIKGRNSDPDLSRADPFLYRAETPRALTSSPGTAYVKIAEGCPNHCTYCTIPSIRGPQNSRQVDDVLTELTALAENNIIEANLVAQDLTAFGLDYKNQPDRNKSLVKLIKGLDALEKAPDWVRLLYLNPALVDQELIEAVANSKRVLPYLDLPLQHSVPRMMKRMGRRPPAEDIAAWIEGLRRAIPGLVVRTTLMVGFPGETEQDFQALLDFIARARIERLGAFAFCPEEGTPAAKMSQTVDPDLAATRLDAVLAAQTEVSREFNESRVGGVEEVLIEGPHPESDLLLAGRCWYQAPEVDGVTIITSGQGTPGKLHQAKIIEAHDYDLVAELVDI